MNDNNLIYIIIIMLGIATIANSVNIITVKQKISEIEAVINKGN